MPFLLNVSRPNRRSGSAVKAILTGAIRTFCGLPIPVARARNLNDAAIIRLALNFRTASWGGCPTILTDSDACSCRSLIERASGRSEDRRQGKEFVSTWRLGV